MIGLTVNTDKEEYDYSSTTASVDDMLKSVKILHPDWTSMVFTLTNHRKPKET